MMIPSIFDGYQFGVWYPYPEHIPASGKYIVAFPGAVGTCEFVSNKAGNGGHWRNPSITPIYWMPLPTMPPRKRENQ